MESKGQRENTRKTKEMRYQVSKGQDEDSGKHPCSVCRKVVGHKSIMCVACHSWFHKRCSEISGRLMNIVDFHCIRCLDGDSVQAVLLIKVFIRLSSIYPMKTWREKPRIKGVAIWMLKKCKDHDLLIASFQFIIFQLWLLHNSSDETGT